LSVPYSASHVDWIHFIDSAGRLILISPAGAGHNAHDGPSESAQSQTTRQFAGHAEEKVTEKLIMRLLLLAKGHWVALWVLGARHHGKHVRQGREGSSSFRRNAVDVRIAKHILEQKIAR
jgi:hypothetical protein